MTSEIWTIRIWAGHGGVFSLLHSHTPFEVPLYRYTIFFLILTNILTYVAKATVSQRPWYNTLIGGIGASFGATLLGICGSLMVLLTGNRALALISPLLLIGLEIYLLSHKYEKGGNDTPGAD